MNKVFPEVRVAAEKTHPYRVALVVGETMWLLDCWDASMLCNQLGAVALEQAAKVGQLDRVEDAISMAIEQFDLAQAVQVLGLHALIISKAAEELDNRSKFTKDEWLKKLTHEARLAMSVMSPEILESITSELLEAADSKPPDEPQ